MKITLNKNVLINKFLSPISKVTDKCVLSLFSDHIHTLVTTTDSNPILYSSINTNCDIGDNNEITLNIPNINAFIKILTCINSNEIELTLNSNNIEYNSLNIKFKYHLLEDGVIEKSPVSVDKIKALTFDSEFIIDKDCASNISKGSLFAVDSNKIYFYMKDNKVYAELTDKEIANTDSVSYFITDEFNGIEIKKPMLINLDIFKMFYGLKEDIITKINTKNRIIMFKFEKDDYRLQYIVSPLIK